MKKCALWARSRSNKNVCYCFKMTFYRASQKAIKYVVAALLVTNVHKL